jgi:ADP-ribose pyrophosphatase YjhB (NUDIX family)
MPSSINREEVERRLAQLRTEYDPTVAEEREVLDAEEFDGFAELARDGYTGGGYAWVVREEPLPTSETMPDPEDCESAYPRVLLGLGRGEGAWGTPGGGREGGESYEEAAVREVREETGIECEVVDCVHVRETTFERERSETDERDGSGQTIHTLWVFFEARQTGGGIDVQETELDGAAWFHDLPEPLHHPVRGHADWWDPSPGEPMEP